MKVECSHCRKSFQVKDEYAGRKGRCPACKEILVISPPSTSEARCCPKCHKPVFGEDVVCTFCGFDTRMKNIPAFTMKETQPETDSFVPPITLFENIRKWVVIAAVAVVGVWFLPAVTYRGLYDVGPTKTVIRNFSQISEIPLAQTAVNLANERMHIMTQGMLKDETRFKIEPPKTGCRHLMIACPNLNTKGVQETIKVLEPYRPAMVKERGSGKLPGEGVLLVVNTSDGSLVATTDQEGLFGFLQLVTVFKDAVFEGFRLKDKTYFGTMRSLEFDVTLKKKERGAGMVQELFKTVTIIPSNAKEAASVEELKAAIAGLADDIEKVPAVAKGPTPFIRGGTFKSLLTQKYKECPTILLCPRVIEDRILDAELLAETEEEVAISGNGRVAGPAELLGVMNILPEGRKFRAIYFPAPKIRVEEIAQAVLILKDLPLYETYTLTRGAKEAGSFRLPMTRFTRGTWWLSLVSFTVLSLLCCRGTVMAGSYINLHEHLSPQKVWTLTGVCGVLLAGMLISIAFALSVIETKSVVVGEPTYSFMINAAGGVVLFILLGFTTYLGADSEMAAKTVVPKRTFQTPKS